MPSWKAIGGTFDQLIIVSGTGGVQQNVGRPTAAYCEVCS
jgi:hypothetical protein